MRERWAEIRGFKDYMISNRGRLKCLARYVDNKYGTLNWRKEYITRGSFCSTPYLHVVLRRNKIGYKKMVHQLVAMAFIPNPLKRRHVNHKDRIACNNNDWNLEWTDSRDNTLHGNSFRKHSSRYACVSYRKDSIASPWVAQIQYKRVRHYLGRYSTELGAAKAVKKFMKKKNIITKYKTL